MAPKKSKKTADSINSKLALVMKSGKGMTSGSLLQPYGPPLQAETDVRFFKVTLGYSSVIKSLRTGKAKLVIIAGNSPPLRKSELECEQSKRHAYIWQDSN